MRNFRFKRLRPSAMARPIRDRRAGTVWPKANQLKRPAFPPAIKNKLKGALRSRALQKCRSLQFSRCQRHYGDRPEHRAGIYAVFPGWYVEMVPGPAANPVRRCSRTLPAVVTACSIPTACYLKRHLDFVVDSNKRISHRPGKLYGVDRRPDLSIIPAMARPRRLEDQTLRVTARRGCLVKR